jgi:LacI family transcriptional regulator
MKFSNLITLVTNQYFFGHTIAMPDRTRRVALIYDAKLPYDLKVISGIARYVQEGAELNIYIEEDALQSQRLPDLKSWHGDGILADLDDPGVAAAVSRAKLPVVGFGGGYGWYSRESPIPYFFSNQTAVADLAADHLIERGFRHFAFCGLPQTPANLWGEERCLAFAKRLETRGFSCHVYPVVHKSTRQWTSVLASLGAWLKTLPKPVGLMAANDKRARHVLEACHTYGLQVPEEVAVIGVDNDEVLCELSSPQLSSVEQDAKRIGYEAIALLDRLMGGEKPGQRHFFIDPLGVVTRRSTDILAVEDRLVASTISFIQSSASQGIRVRDVVNSLAISRSSLETRFKAATGQTISAAIRRAQLQRAQRMIAETNLAMKEVAAVTGFKSVQHMTTSFGKAFGRTPAKYRKAIIE